MALQTLAHHKACPGEAGPQPHGAGGYSTLFQRAESNARKPSGCLPAVRLPRKSNAGCPAVPLAQRSAPTFVRGPSGESLRRGSGDPGPRAAVHAATAWPVPSGGVPGGHTGRVRPGLGGPDRRGPVGRRDLRREPGGPVRGQRGLSPHPVVSSIASGDEAASPSASGRRPSAKSSGSSGQVVAPRAAVLTVVAPRADRPAANSAPGLAIFNSSSSVLADRPHARRPGRANPPGASPAEA